MILRNIEEDKPFDVAIPIKYGRSTFNGKTQIQEDFVNSSCLIKLFWYSLFLRVTIN